jgi:sulfur carrier protein
VKLTVNGQGREVEDAASVAELLALLGLRSDQVAVEVNGAIVRRARHLEHRLGDGDRVEIVTFVGGG